MGLTAEQFFELTPRQFHILKDRHQEKMEHAEWLTGIIASEVANRSVRHPETWMKPTDFMPSLAGKKMPVKRIRIDRKKSVAEIRAFFAAQTKKQNGG